MTSEEPPVTTLQNIIFFNEVAQLEEYLANNGSPDTTFGSNCIGDGETMSALGWALYHGREGMVPILLKAGANPNRAAHHFIEAKTVIGQVKEWTDAFPLDMARSWEVALFLLRNGANLYSRATGLGWIHFFQKVDIIFNEFQPLLVPDIFKIVVTSFYNQHFGPLEVVERDVPDDPGFLNLEYDMDSEG